MLTIDRANVHMEPVPAGVPAGGAPAGGGASSGASSVGSMSDEEFRDRVLRVLDDVLREMDRRGSR